MFPIEIIGKIADYDSSNLFNLLLLNKYVNNHLLSYIKCLWYLRAKSAITMKEVEKLGNLEYYGFCNLTDEKLKHLKNLKDLYIGRKSKITDEGLHYLEQLKFLFIDGNNNITDKGIKYLKNLKELTLYHNRKITDKSIEQLQQLEILRLDSRVITKESIGKLTNLRYLQHWKGRQPLDDDTVKKLVHLEYLQTDSENITDKGIKDLTKLRYLRLMSNENITNEGIQNLVNLEHLELPECYGIDFYQIEILRHKKLKFVDVANYDLLDFILGPRI